MSRPGKHARQESTDQSPVNKRMPVVDLTGSSLAGPPQRKTEAQGLTARCPFTDDLYNEDEIDEEEEEVGGEEEGEEGEEEEEYPTHDSDGAELPPLPEDGPRVKVWAVTTSHYDPENQTVEYYQPPFCHKFIVVGVYQSRDAALRAGYDRMFADEFEIVGLDEESPTWLHNPIKYIQRYGRSRCNGGRDNSHRIQGAELDLVVKPEEIQVGLQADDGQRYVIMIQSKFTLSLTRCL